MIIRSITSFISLKSIEEFSADVLTRLQEASARLKDHLNRAGYSVQSSRLATNSFTEYMPLNNPDLVVQQAQLMESVSLQAGFDYLSLGPAQAELKNSYDLIPRIFQDTNHVFLTGNLTTKKREIDLYAVRMCANIVATIADYDPNGFKNLYFSAIANVPGGIPFFPSAYQDKAGVGFALAMEAADLAVTAFNKASTLKDARENYIKAVESAAQGINAVMKPIVDLLGIEFYGFDMTPGPFIVNERSAGSALELLGLPQVGQHGSLAASAFLMDALDQAEFQRSGFNGLMLPILEDNVLAKRVEEGALTLKDLLLMSAVCGTGLDTVPVPGSTSIDEIAAVLLDVASLSLRLRKPLTARLMPIPGKAAGELTTFDFPFFTNTRVMAIESSGLSGLLGGSEKYLIHPKYK